MKTVKARRLQGQYLRILKKLVEGGTITASREGRVAPIQGRRYTMTAMVDGETRTGELDEAVVVYLVARGYLDADCRDTLGDEIHYRPSATGYGIVATRGVIRPALDYPELFDQPDVEPWAMGRPSGASGYPGGEP